MRLIDADKLEEEMNELCCGECGCCGLSDCPAYSQPTAYDVDNVLKFLEEKRDESDMVVKELEEDKYLSTIMLCQTHKLLKAVYEDIIEIIKAGDAKKTIIIINKGGKEVFPGK